MTVSKLGKLNALQFKEEKEDQGRRWGNNYSTHLLLEVVLYNYNFGNAGGAACAEVRLH